MISGSRATWTPSPPAPGASVGGVMDHPASASLSVMPWAICDSALPLSLPHAADPPASGDEVALQGPGGPEAGDVAVVRARGVVVPRAEDHWGYWGHAFGAEGLASRVEEAAAAAKAVAVLFDSPGGSAAGVKEAAARIAAVSAETPVVAVADYLCASGAYWLAAACSAIAVSPSAQIGSVGVRMLRPSIHRMLDADGVDVDAIYRGDGKLDYAIWTELGDDGRERLQRNVDVCYTDFVAAVAAGRGVARKTITGEWGARLLCAGDAVEASMADEARTASDVVARLATPAGRRRYAQIGAARRTAAAMITLSDALGASIAPDPQPTGGAHV